MSRYVARLMAPLAIAVVAIGIYLVVHDNLATHHSASAQTVGRPHAHRHDRHRHSAAKHPKRKYYTVKSGDTLSAIAGHTGVSMSRLEKLNPSLQPPYSLHTGQRLRLRR